MDDSHQYPPVEFCRKYGHVLAPGRTCLLSPAAAFSRYSGGDPAVRCKTRRALRVTLRRLRQLHQHCVVCDCVSDRTFGELEDSCRSCHVICCSLQCAVIGRLNEKHDQLCVHIWNQRVDQFVECLPVPVNVLALLDTRLKLPLADDKQLASSLDFTAWLRGQRQLNEAISNAPSIVLQWRDFAVSASSKDDHLLARISAEDVAASLRRLASGLVSLPLTLAHGLRQFNVVATRRTVRVHMLGADAPEVNMINTSLCGMMHATASLAATQHLHLLLVSPDCHVQQLARQAPLHKPRRVHAATRCNKRSGEVVVSAWEGLYHDFHSQFVDKEQSCDNVTVSAPDIVYCIHPGAHAEDLFTMWRPTLQILLSRNCPVVMTTYNEQEFQGTLEKLDSLNVEYVYRGRNPMSSMHVKQTPADKTLTWANNAYLIMFKGYAKKS